MVPSVTENNISVPPFRTRLPVPFGVKVISMFWSAPTALISVALFIDKADCTVPITVVSVAGSTLK